MFERQPFDVCQFSAAQAWLSQCHPGRRRNHQMENTGLPGHSKGRHIMNSPSAFPYFDDCLPDMNHYLIDLVQTYEAGRINSWDDLEQKVNAYFTPERMAQMESLVPGWKKMASYSDG